MHKNSLFHFLKMFQCRQRKKKPLVLPHSKFHSGTVSMSEVFWEQPSIFKRKQRWNIRCGSECTFCSPPMCSEKAIFIYFIYFNGLTFPVRQRVLLVVWNETLVNSLHFCVALVPGMVTVKLVVANCKRDAAECWLLSTVDIQCCWA